MEGLLVGKLTLLGDHVPPFMPHSSLPSYFLIFGSRSCLPSLNLFFKTLSLLLLQLRHQLGLQKCHVFLSHASHHTQNYVTITIIIILIPFRASSFSFSVGEDENPWWSWQVLCIMMQRRKSEHHCIFVNRKISSLLNYWFHIFR